MFEVRGLEGSPDRRILTVCKPPVMVFSSYDVDAIKADSSNRFLRFKYSLAKVKEEFATDGVPTWNLPIIEFDLCNAFVLNWPGELSLTGGYSEDLYRLQFHWRAFSGPIQLDWHNLTAYCPRLTRYTFPLYHTEFWVLPSSVVPAAAVYAALNPAQLQTTPMPITGKREITVNEDCFVVSRVRL